MKIEDILLMGNTMKIYGSNGKKKVAIEMTYDVINRMIDDIAIGQGIYDIHLLLKSQKVEVNIDSKNKRLIAIEKEKDSTHTVIEVKVLEMEKVWDGFISYVVKEFKR